MPLTTAKVLKARSLASSLGSWMNGMEWSFFVTLTTPYELSLPSGRRLVERTHSQWGTLLVADGEGIRTMWVAERNELRDGHHLHLLLSLPKRFHDKGHYGQLVEAYQRMVGAKVERIDRHTGHITWANKGRIDLQRFDKRRNASGYLTKYILKGTKGQLLDWDFYESTHTHTEVKVRSEGEDGRKGKVRPAPKAWTTRTHVTSV